MAIADHSETSIEYRYVFTINQFIFIFLGNEKNGEFRFLKTYRRQTDEKVLRIGFYKFYNYKNVEIVKDNT